MAGVYFLSLNRVSFVQYTTLWNLVSILTLSSELEVFNSCIAYALTKYCRPNYITYSVDVTFDYYNLL